MNSYKMIHLRAEWLRFSRDRTHLAALALLALLCLGAAFNGLQQVQLRGAVQQQATVDAEQRLARMRQEVQAIAADRPLVDQGLDPASPAKLANGDGAFRVGLPTGPGAALALGSSVLLPQSFEVTARTRLTQAANQNLTNPANSVAGSYDLAFVIVVLLPLAAIALAWRIRAHDREQGIWRLLDAVPGATRGLLVAALLLRLTLLAGVAWLAGALAVFGHAGFGMEALQVWAAYAALVLMYAALWLGIAALMNLGTLPSPTLALGLVGVWLLAVFVVPAAIETGAPPMPSRLATIAELRALDATSRIDGEALDEGYRRDHPEAIPGAVAPQKGDRRIGMFSAQLAFDMKARPIVARVDDAVALRHAHVERWSGLSPALAAQLALEALAGSDPRRHQDFVAQVDAYQTRWRDYFRPMVLAMRNLRVEDYDGIPRFRYQQPSDGAPTAALTRAAAAFMVWLMVAALIAAAARRKRSEPAPAPGQTPSGRPDKKAV